MGWGGGAGVGAGGRSGARYPAALPGRAGGGCTAPAGSVGLGTGRREGRGRGAFVPPRRLGGGSPGCGDRGAVPGHAASGWRFRPAGGEHEPPAMGALHAGGDRPVALTRRAPGRTGVGLPAELRHGRDGAGVAGAPRYSSAPDGSPVCIRPTLLPERGRHCG